YLLVNNFGHVFVFSFCGFVLGHWLKRVSSIVPIIVLISLAAGSELLQHFVAGRQPDLDDLTLNIIAGVTGFALVKQFSGARNYHT
ncbi:MAG: VanZ family protein, partial [Gammaproteobacteria bacterium]|nr:VanZ family protein [Gammaproteobacteria bacterium]